MHERRSVRRQALEQVLSDPWVAQQRAAGAAILVCGMSGRILHADDGIASLAERDGLPTNAFDLISPGHVVEASSWVAQHAGRPLVTRFPWVTPSGDLRWCRFEVRWPAGVIMMAVTLEEDPTRHRLDAERAS